MINLQNTNEEELFIFLKENLIQDLTKSEWKYDSKDATSDTYNYVIELKCRYSHYDKLLIEKKKYDFLKSFKEKNVRYICSTPLGIYSFNINNIEIKDNEWLIEIHNKTTNFGKKELIEKKIFYLDVFDKEKVNNKYVKKMNKNCIDILQIINNKNK